MPKAEKVLEKDRYNRLAQWLMFLDNPNTERVDEIMKENEEVKKAKKCQKGRGILTQINNCREFLKYE